MRLRFAVLPRGLLISMLALLALAFVAGSPSGPPVAAERLADPIRQGPARPVQPTPIPLGPYDTLSTGGNPNVDYGFTMAYRERIPNLVADHFQWAEFEIDWGTSEPSRGNYNWANVDNITNTAAGLEIGIIFRVDQSPAWANGRGTNGWYPPTNPNDYANFIQALAAHVSGRLRYAPAYEIWNEPNISDNWGGACPSAAAYTAMVRAAYPAVKRGDPYSPVLVGSVTTVGALPPEARPNTCAVDDLAFLDQMYNAGALGFFDAISVHPYGFGDAPEANPRQLGRTLVFRRAELQREVMLAHGDAAHHMWITETGWAIDP
ncbi:MAG TPA: hypothetical protein VM536_12520, partial [Chloroflexia bacterium]|nr:hypothetical protein [Chloroflexia bacterium]